MFEFSFCISEFDRAFLAGLLEGEAHLAVREQNGGKSFGCAVYVRVRDDDQDLLEWLVGLTGLGRLRWVPARRTSRPQIAWKIESQADCRHLIRLIGDCGFHGRRAAELRLWTEAVLAWTCGTAAERRATLPRIAFDLQAARRFGGGADTARPFEGTTREQLGYITGLVCAEGCFQMSDNRPRFSMHLRSDDRPLLELLRATTGIGAIYSHTPAPPLNPSSSWTVTARAELEQLLLLLHRGQLPGRKGIEMETWAVAVHELCSAARIGVRPRPALLKLASSRLRAARTYRGSTRPLLELPGRDIRAECLAALRAWSAGATGRLACTGYTRWRRDHASAPARDTVARTFGSWHAAMEAAGLADRAARRVTTRVGGEATRRVWREAQRARVVDAVRRFEAEHGRLPRAMEFFKWRLAVMPDTPTQATVYNLFPGGWKAVLEACGGG